MLVGARVLAEMGPFATPAADAPLGPARISGVRVQMTGDRHAHVAAVAHSPAGTAGYVLEMRRDGAARPWVVTELSRAEERHLVGAEAEDNTEDAIDRRTSRLPAKLSGLIRATQHACDQAAEQLRRAEARHAEIQTQPRNTPRQRAAIATQTTDARRRVTA